MCAVREPQFFDWYGNPGLDPLKGFFGPNWCWDFYEVVSLFVKSGQKSALIQVTFLYHKN